ncbi:hypothetical protein OG301_01175 [Streptomyces platensis]|nr:hypothetical protein OG301_01175 [Streptomyces platensis]
MALEPAVIAPVVNHPSLPLDDPGGLEISEAVQARDEIIAFLAERLRTRPE